MTWNLAISALATISVISLVSGFFGGQSKIRDEFRGPLHEYLLANQGLEQQSVVQLLFSTSFSLNGMLYQVWLGYNIGLWALVIQGAWALSYVLLATRVERVRTAKSLHSFLGENFGKWTQILAGACSIVGFTLLIGWEFNVGKSTFEGLFNLDSTQKVSSSLVLIFTFATVFASFLYTVVGGLRSNAFANSVQNFVKIIVFSLMILLVYYANNSSPPAISLQAALFPTFSQAIANLGIFGLITNLAFSLVWQFVDMSTWQSVIASSRKLDINDTKNALRLGGLAVFIAPGIIGTILGALLAGTPDVSDNNVMTKLVSILPSDSPTLIFLVLVALLASIMSMIDGLLLAAAYSLVCDLLHTQESLEQIDTDRARAESVLTVVRLFVGTIAIVGTLGVLVGLVGWLNISLFDLTYVTIICQLALTGPVFLGLQGRFSANTRMVYAIIFGLIVGFGAFTASRITGQEWLITGAGFFGMVASIVVAEIVTRSGRLM